MVVGPRTNGRGTVSLVAKVLFSMLAILLMFEGLVAAFHLLNLPSDRAVVGGMCLLLIVAAGGLVAFRFIWIRSWTRTRKWKRLV